MASRWTSVRVASAAADPPRLERGLGGLGGRVVVDRLVLRGGTSVSRRLDASADRTRSTALRCTIVSSQPSGAAAGGVVPAGVRQISRYASWVTSSAWAGSRTTRSARP